MGIDVALEPCALDAEVDLPPDVVRELLAKRTRDPLFGDVFERGEPSVGKWVEPFHETSNCGAYSGEPLSRRRGRRLGRRCPNEVSTARRDELLAELRDERGALDGLRLRLRPRDPDLHTLLPAEADARVDEALVRNDSAAPRHRLPPAAFLVIASIRPATSSSSSMMGPGPRFSR